MVGSIKKTSKHLILFKGFSLLNLGLFDISFDLSIFPGCQDFIRFSTRDQQLKKKEFLLKICAPHLGIYPTDVI